MVVGMTILKLHKRYNYFFLIKFTMGQIFQFSYAGLKANQFAMIREVAVSEPVELSISVSICGDYNKSLLKIGLMIEYSNNEQPILLVETQNDFLIEGHDWLKLSKENSESVELTKDFVDHLVAISISTARGFLSAKTENTPFSKYFLPLINVKNLNCKELIIEKR